MGNQQSGFTLIELIAVDLTDDPFYTIDNCDDGGSLLTGGLPTGYSITAVAIATDQTAQTCTLNGVSSETAQFVIISAAGGN